MNPIQLSLTLDEVNLVLEALGELPYARVHGLIAGIHTQATSQLRGGAGGAALPATEGPPA